jgi:hypothetical protein
MAIDTFKYPSEWTESFAAYTVHKQKVIGAIVDHMENYRTRLPSLNKQVDLLKENFFSCNKLLEILK